MITEMRALNRAIIIKLLDTIYYNQGFKVLSQ